ncbi:hypothetical protein Tco_1476902 [Tanacetum coccineum]
MSLPFAMRKQYVKKCYGEHDVEIETVGEGVDENDKLTELIGEMQLKQEDQGCVHASNELQLHVVHVVAAPDIDRLEILGVVIAQEDLNSIFLNSLPPEWNTHVVVWMNKAEIETMSIDDLYNKFKIVEQSVKKSVGASSGAQNLAFMIAPSTSSTNDVNAAKPAYEVSTASQC